MNVVRERKVMPRAILINGRRVYKHYNSKGEEMCYSGNHHRKCYRPVLKASDASNLEPKMEYRPEVLGIIEKPVKEHLVNPPKKVTFAKPEKEPVLGSANKSKDKNQERDKLMQDIYKAMNTRKSIKNQ